MFKSAPSPQLPEPPPPPPNPPMFGANQAQGQRQRKKAQQSTGFASTIMGDVGGANTASKTLIGQ